MSSSLNASTPQEYKDKIATLIKQLPFEIDTDIKIEGRIPTTVSSEFITNKEQGDWAERVVHLALSNNQDLIIVRYGRNDNLSAGDEGFKEFYQDYQKELNTIGKKPDLLVYKKEDYFEGIENTKEGVTKAILAIEVRSSSFLLKKYQAYMEHKNNNASQKIQTLIQSILSNQTLKNLLRQKNSTLLDMFENIKISDFRNGLSFKFRGLSSTPDLIELSNIIKEIKNNIKILQTRDYLSITPKLEDIALVNRWIQTYNVPHFYLQVFFDSAYIISFENILQIVNNHNNEGFKFFIERDTKNQGKTTIKIDVRETSIIIDEIEIPNHQSEMKELDRGRLIFYVHFDDSTGKVNSLTFDKVVKNAIK